MRNKRKTNGTGKLTASPRQQCVLLRVNLNMLAPLDDDLKGLEAEEHHQLMGGTVRHTFLSVLPRRVREENTLSMEIDYTGFMTIKFRADWPKPLGPMSLVMEASPGEGISTIAESDGSDIQNIRAIQSRLILMDIANAELLLTQPAVQMYREEFLAQFSGISTVFTRREFKVMVDNFTRLIITAPKQEVDDFPHCSLCGAGPWENMLPSVTELYNTG